MNKSTSNPFLSINHYCAIK